MTPIGVILAGGAGRRIGGSKATVELRGRPLIRYPLDALRGALPDVAVIAKADTELPELPGVSVWIERPRARHPVVGIVEALGLAGDAAVLACAVDLPFVTAQVVRALADYDPSGAPAVVAAGPDGRLQPLLGCYQPAALELLGPHAVAPHGPLTELVAGMGPRVLELDDPDVLFNVNAPDDLLLASAMLDRRTIRR
jgi:molybdopterin-guanine dinucleotide biosynthesis protein A